MWINKNKFTESKVHMFLTYIDDVCLFVSFYKKEIWLCLIWFFSLVYFCLVLVCFAFFVLVLFSLLCFLCVFWVSIVLFDFSLFMFVCFVVGEIDSMWTYFNPWRDLTHPHSLCQSHSSLCQLFSLRFSLFHAFCCEFAHWASIFPSVKVYQCTSGPVWKWTFSVMFTGSLLIPPYGEEDEPIFNTNTINNLHTCEGHDSGFLIMWY